MSNITMEFARRDDCLDRMVPSDLRLLIGERDRLREELAALSQQEAVTLDNAPIGTKAPSHTGGYWIRVERGWKWNTGATFGRPGGDWTGELIPPSHPQPQKVESKVPQSVEEFKALIGEYFELGVAEGAEGRNHDTKDHAAQRKLDEINSALAGKELVPDWLKEFMRDKEAIECILEWAQNEEQIVNVGNVSGERDELLESSAGWVTRLLKAMLSAPQEGV